VLFEPADSARRSWNHVTVVSTLSSACATAGAASAARAAAARGSLAIRRDVLVGGRFLGVGIELHRPIGQVLLLVRTHGEAAAAGGTERHEHHQRDGLRRR
jgi:hypothetical protein